MTLFRSMLACSIVISLLALTGYAGQVALAQYAIAGLGAFVAGRLVAVADLPFELAIAAGAAAAIPVGVLVGLPALRPRGLALAVATLGLAPATAPTLLLTHDLTGGFSGPLSGGITPPHARTTNTAH